MQGVQHTALLVAQRLVAVPFCAVLKQNLAQRNVAEPRIPVPQHIEILVAPGGKEGKDKGFARLAIHAFHVTVDVFAAQCSVSLHVLCGALWHLGHRWHGNERGAGE